MAWVSNPSRNITSPQSTTMPYCTAPIGRELIKAGTSNASSVLLTVFSSNYLLLFSGASGSTGDRRIVSRRHEGICEEVAVGETSGRPEIASRMADHQWVAAGIDLPPRQIGQIPQHGVMDQAHSSVPIQIGLRQDRDELEPARARGPLPRQIGQEQTALTAATPIQVHRTFVATLDQIFDDRLQRREAGSCRKANNRLVRIRAQMEISVRQFDVERVAWAEFGKHPLRETSPRHVPDMQLHAVALVRRVRHRKIAGVAVRHFDAQILAGQEFCANARRKTQLQDGHIVDRPMDAIDLGGHRLARVGIAALNSPGVNKNIGPGPSLAEQNVIAGTSEMLRTHGDFAPAKVALARPAAAFPA